VEDFGSLHRVDSQPVRFHLQRNLLYSGWSEPHIRITDFQAKPPKTVSAITPILWDVKQGTPISTWKFPGRIWKLMFAPDGRHLAPTAPGLGIILRLKFSVRAPWRLYDPCRYGKFQLLVPENRT
jgi:hypothetical protein